MDLIIFMYLVKTTATQTLRVSGQPFSLSTSNRGSSISNGVNLSHIIVGAVVLYKYQSVLGMEPQLLYLLQ